MPDRREWLLGGAWLLGAGAFGVAVLPAPAAAAEAATPIPSDGALIAGLVGIEQLVEFVYTQAIRSGALDPPTTRLALELLTHEHAHALALAARLPALGVAAPTSPRTAHEAEAALKLHHTVVRFARRRSARQWLSLLSDVEDVLERNYHMAISQLRRPELLTLCAEVLASEAQHSALLGQLLNPSSAAKALPDPFINGG